MTSADFLPLANQLAASSSEPEWRTAIGRAYYAAFHVARQVLEDLGFRVPQADRAHAYLSMRLNNCGNALLQQTASDLHSLRSLRNHADYDCVREILPRAENSEHLSIFGRTEHMRAFDARHLCASGQHELRRRVVHAVVDCSLKPAVAARLFGVGRTVIVHDPIRSQAA